MYAICDNPSYYAGCYLRSIKGNIRLSKCRTKSLNVAYLGKGEKWSITEQIVKLTNNHQQDTNKNSQLKVSLHRFKSKLNGQKRIDDINTKDYLTQHAYTTYYGKSSRAVRYLQFTIGENRDALIWPVKEGSDKSNITIIKFGE